VQIKPDIARRGPLVAYIVRYSSGLRPCFYSRNSQLVDLTFLCHCSSPMMVSMKISPVRKLRSTWGQGRRKRISLQLSHRSSLMLHTRRVPCCQPRSFRQPHHHPLECCQIERYQGICHIQFAGRQDCQWPMAIGPNLNPPQLLRSIPFIPRRCWNTSPNIAGSPSSR